MGFEDPQVNDSNGKGSRATDIPISSLTREPQKLLVPLGPSAIRNASAGALIRALVEQCDNGWVPNLDEAKALTCRDMLATKDGAYDTEGNFYTESHEHLLPWPESRVSKNINSLGPYYLDKYTGLVAKGNILGDIYDTDDIYAIHEVVRGLIPRMKADDLAQLRFFIIDHLDDFHDFGISGIEDFSQLVDLAYLGLDYTSDDALVLGDKVVHILLATVDESGITDSPKFDGEYDSKSFDYLHGLTKYKRQMSVYRAILSDKYSETEKTKVIGMILRENLLPDELNTLRSMMRDAKLSGQERRQLSELIREALGLLSGLPVHARLTDLYEAIKFEEYPLNRLSEAKRVNSFMALFSKLGIGKLDEIVDLGSGSGWLVSGLRKAGFRLVLGVDQVTRHIEIAKSSYGDFFLQADWRDKLPELFRKTKAFVSVGRTLPHTETEANFTNLLGQIHNYLDEEGHFIFDMPDSSSGSYFEKRESFKNAMRRYGFSERELKRMPYIVDSPDGRNFYNRYVPDRREILWNLKIRGFEVIEVIEESIEGGESGDRNLIFVARKAKKERSKGASGRSNPLWWGSSG